MRHFELRTRISAPPDQVWRRVTTPAGINDELMPVLRMTIPSTMRGKTIDDVEPGSYLGRSWLLLFGILPIDFDAISIAELEAGRRFREQSHMLSMRRWGHERVVMPDDDGCWLEDRVTFELRGASQLLGPERLVRKALLGLFNHRHRRVVRHFAATPTAEP